MVPAGLGESVADRQAGMAGADDHGVCGGHEWFLLRVAGGFCAVSGVVCPGPADGFVRPGPRQRCSDEASGGQPVTTSTDTGVGLVSAS